jgi:hypothetical protein
MNQLFHLFFDICLLRKGPQDVPASAFLTGTVTAINMIIATLGSVLVSGFVVGIEESLLGLALSVVMLAIVLQLSGRMARFQQTFTAIMGCEVLFHFIMVPISMMLISSTETDATAQFTAILWIILVVWYLVVIAHILRHAMTTNLFLALVISLCIFVVTWNVTNMVFT